MLEINGNPVTDHRLDLPDAPIGAIGVADAHAWFDQSGHGASG